MTSIALTAVPSYIENEAHASDSLLEELWQTALALAPARRAAAVEGLRKAAASVLDDAIAAKCADDWRAVFDGSVAAYIVAADWFNHCEPVEFRIPVYMTADKRRFSKVLEHSQSQFSGDAVELPAPNGYARVKVERIPAPELIAEHLLAVGAFEECFRELLKPATSRLGALKDAVTKRVQFAELEALVDQLLFFLCGETEVVAEGNRVEVFSWTARNRVELKLKTLLSILDESSPYATVH